MQALAEEKGSSWHLVNPIFFLNLCLNQSIEDLLFLTLIQWSVSIELLLPFNFVDYVMVLAKDIG
jgi:hypothetical protein